MKIKIQGVPLKSPVFLTPKTKIQCVNCKRERWVIGKEISIEPGEPVTDTDLEESLNNSLIIDSWRSGRCYFCNKEGHPVTAYEMGKEARKDCIHIIKNPFPKGQKHTDWLNGWMDQNDTEKS